VCEQSVGIQIMEVTLAILGDGSVGKSSLTANFRNDGFDAVYKQTVGCDFYEKKIQIRDNLVSLRIWDIGGQSIHSKNIQQYVSNSSAIFLVYDVTNIESFNNLDDWKRTLEKYCPNGTSNVYLVGNKVDMISQRIVTEKQQNLYIKDNELRGGLYMSAKTGENVVRAFYKVAGEILGTPLTETELETHNKVLKVIINEGNDNGGRTAFADEIEEEMRREEEEAKRKADACQCAVS
jgi:small GTP-binding protein